MEHKTLCVKPNGLNLIPKRDKSSLKRGMFDCNFKEMRCNKGHTNTLCNKKKHVEVTELFLLLSIINNV